jgi:hypothetical protein
VEDRDIEVFIKAKRGTLIPNVATGLAVLLFFSVVVLEYMGINHDLTATLLTWAAVLYFAAFGTSKWAYVSRQQLINVIERQINNDPKALEYLANKSSASTKNN